jgi:RND family efflux transporter MFP subunit
MSNYSWRALSQSVAALLMITSIPISHAADDIPVTAAQMKSLGIAVQRVDRAGDAPGLSYPAQVVLPPQNEQIVSAPVAGLVQQILVNEHQIVRPGQALLRLSSPEFGELQLALMEAASRSNLSQQALARERDLFKEGIIPQRRVFEAESAASSDLARLHQAKAALRLAGLDTASIDRIAGGGDLQEALVIRARSAGTILSLKVTPGERVADADVLLRLATFDRLWLDIQLPTDRASSWSADRPITVADRQVSAKPLSAGSVVSQNQTVILRAEVTAGAANLHPGEFVQARVPLAANHAAKTVPLSAVIRHEKAAYVFVRTPQGFVAHPVKVIASAGQTVSVTGAFKPNDEVAVSSVIALKAAWLGESGGE